MSFPAPEIFKAYDIRGIVGKSLTVETVRGIGQALGSEALVRGQKSIVIGRDGRLSGPEFATALAEGITSTGIDAIDIGCVATPITYFAAYHLGAQQLCVDHRQPQPAGLQRPEDGAGRTDPLRRDDSGSAPAYRRGRFRHGRRHAQPHRRVPRLHRTHPE